MKTLALAIVAAVMIGSPQHKVMSIDASRELVQTMKAAALEAVATADPDEKGAFVAALHIDGAQLLVVRALHPSVDALEARLTAKQFRDVYLDLQSTPTATGKLFVMDSGADGFPNDADAPERVDVMYEDGTRQTIFNGSRAQKLSADQYLKTVVDADAKYTRLLKLLTAATKTS